MKALAWLLGILVVAVALLAGFIGHRDAPAAAPQPAPTVTATVTVPSVSTVTATATETKHATAKLPSVCVEAMHRVKLMLAKLGSADDGAQNAYDVLDSIKVDAQVDVAALTNDQNKLAHATDQMENGIISAESIQEDIKAELYLCNQQGGIR